MKHPSIRGVYNYWNEQRGARLLPRREDIQPEAIRSLLADTFILSFEPRLGHSVRVAGTRVCALFGRDIRGEAFLDLFSTDARSEVSDLIACLAEEAVGLVASACEQSCGVDMGRFEFMILPLTLNGTAVARFLGALVPAYAAAWGATPGLAKLALVNYRFVGGLCGSALAPVPSRRRRITRRFVVYDGGQPRNPQ